MDPSVIGLIGVVVGALVAGLSSVSVQVLTARATATLDAAKRHDDRQIERARFERDALVGLLNKLESVLLHASAAYAALSDAAGFISVRDLALTAQEMRAFGYRIGDEEIAASADGLIDDIEAFSRHVRARLKHEEAPEYIVAVRPLLDRTNELGRRAGARLAETWPRSSD